MLKTISSSVLSISKSGDSTTSLEVPVFQEVPSVPVFGCPRSKEVFSYIWMEFPDSCSWLLVLPLGTEGKSLATSSLHPFYSTRQVFVQADKIPLSIILSRLISAGSCILASHDKYSKPLMIFIYICWAYFDFLVSLGQGNVELNTTLQIPNFVIKTLLFMPDLLMKKIKTHRLSRLIHSTRKILTLFFITKCCHLPFLYLQWALFLSNFFCLQNSFCLKKLCWIICIFPKLRFISSSLIKKCCN